MRCYLALISLVNILKTEFILGFLFMTKTSYKLHSMILLGCHKQDVIMT